MLKYLIPFLLFICSVQAQAQFTRAEVSVNGLTCSQCSRSVEMALKRLDFIAKVEMDLQQPTAHIVFKKNKAIDFAKLARAVRDAGFDVRSIKTRLPQSLNDESTCFVYNKIMYYNAGNTQSAHSGAELLLLGKDLISKTELDKHKSHIRQAAHTPCDKNVSKEVPFLLLQ